MNIFFLSYLVEEAARAHFNRHVVKMISETCQLLSTAHWVLAPESAQRYFDDKLLWRRTHENHPCAVWARAHPNNYRWLASLGLALCYDYTQRFSTGTPRRHAAETSLRFLAQTVPPIDASAPLNAHGVTEPPQCMPDEYRVPGDAVAAYRAYYQGTEKQALRWWRPKWLPVPADDDCDAHTPDWFTARPIAPQCDYLKKLERSRRPPRKRARVTQQ